MSVVYWLHNNACTAPEKDGYVGVTRILNSRLYEHSRPRSKIGKKRGLKVMVIYMGAHRTCLEMEKFLRPRPQMGWNEFSGGGKECVHSVRSRKKRSTKGIIRSPETCLKLSQRIITPEWRAKIGAANRGKQSFLGKKHTAATKLKLKEAWVRRRMEMRENVEARR